MQIQLNDWLISRQPSALNSHRNFSAQLGKNARSAVTSGSRLRKIHSFSSDFRRALGRERFAHNVFTLMTRKIFRFLVIWVCKGTKSLAATWLRSNAYVTEM